MQEWGWYPVQRIAFQIFANHHRRCVLSSQKPTSPAPLRGHGPSSRVKFKAEEIGFTLKTDDKTLREIEAIQEETVKATQSIRKFAWR